MGRDLRLDLNAHCSRQSSDQRSAVEQPDKAATKEPNDVLTCARLALADIFSPALRTVMLKSLGRTLLLLAGLWLGLTLLVSWAIDLGTYPWLETLVNLLAGLALFVGMAFLVMPVAALFAGLYSDEVAGAVERVHYAFDPPPGRDLPVDEAVRDAIGFAVVALIVNASPCCSCWFRWSTSSLSLAATATSSVASSLMRRRGAI
jgi:hypothetical protein